MDSKSLAQPGLTCQTVSSCSFISSRHEPRKRLSAIFRQKCELPVQKQHLLCKIEPIHLLRRAQQLCRGSWIVPETVLLLLEQLSIAETNWVCN
jgi:hypothetical protein